MATRAYEDMIPVPRGAVRFPLAIPTPAGFDAERPETWPLVDGELELVGGTLYFMPPSADRQQDTSADVVLVLGLWRRAHDEFVVAGNEAGMMLGGEARGADAAVWRRADLGPYEGKYRRTPPVLAVEVQGELEDEAALGLKADWYLARGVQVVWLVLPGPRRVVVITASGADEVTDGALPEHPSLPGLRPALAELFAQIDAAPAAR